MPKQLINIIGVILVVAILAAGILLVGMPMYLQSLETNAQTAQVSQTNDIYQTQVDQLHVEAERFDEITSDVANLQAQIPATTRSDDMFEIVANAASAVGVTVASVNVADPAAWTPRTGTEGGIPPSADQPAAPHMEVPISISISTDDPAKASAFLDQLGMGPRLMGIVSTTLTGSGGAYQLDVEALSFVRTEA